MNKRQQRITGLVLAGILATSAVGAVAMTPASGATSDNVVTSRLAGIKSALSGLVSDGTLTQAQADKVAGTLDSRRPLDGMGRGGMGGHGGPGGHVGRMGMAEVHDAAAKALGLTPDKLRAAVHGGKSLADVAKDQKVSVSSLVKVMVTAAEKELATALKDGDITKAQADLMGDSLTQRITDRVNGVRPEHGMGMGMGMGGGPGHGGRGAGSWGPSSGGATSGSTSTTPSGTT